MQPVNIRSELIDALTLDLVGPAPGLGNANEVLNQFPSRWYLTGFLVPTEASDDQKQDDDAGDEMEELGASGPADDNDEPDRSANRRTNFPSSIGVSVLIPPETESLDVNVRRTGEAAGQAFGTTG